MNCTVRINRPIAFIEVDAGDRIHNIQGKRRMRISLPAPADPSLRAAVLPGALLDESEDAGLKVDAPKLDKSRAAMDAAMLEFLKHQPKPLSAAQISESDETERFFGRRISDRIAYDAVASLRAKGLVEKIDILAETPHVNQTYRTKAALWCVAK